MNSAQVTYHFHCTIPPHNESGSFSTKIKLAEEAWRCGPSLQLLKTSLDILTLPERGDGARGWVTWTSEEQPKELSSAYHALLTKAIFKDPDEQRTSDLSLPVHHTPHNESGCFSTKIKLAEEAWRR